MSKDQLKYEIDRVLDHFSDNDLQEILLFLKNLEQKYPTSILNSVALEKILSEDKELLERLAK